MATSPNYGWLEPDNTDLVKNGALAIRTLGNAIDTTMATMTPKSIVDAKGDLIAASAADTPARLAVGNNGETLVADSSTSTGLRYTAGTSQSNPVLNSNFSVWQRGTSISVTANPQYVADRWVISRSATSTMTVSRQATGDTTNLPNIQYCGRFQRNAGDTSTTAPNFAQSFETVNSIPYAGKTVTLSFYARVGANWSAGTSFNCYFNSGTGTDQNTLSGYTGSVSIAASNPTLTTTWVRYTLTGTVATTATEIAFGFYWTPSGTAGANDYVEMTGVQIDVGSVALPYRPNGATIQGELAACQRYYWQPDQYTTSACYVRTTTTGYCSINMLVPMRVAPSANYTAGDLRISSTSADFVGSSVSGLLASKESVLIQLITSGGMTAGAGGIFFPVTNSAIKLSAEL